MTIETAFEIGDAKLHSLRISLSVPPRVRNVVHLPQGALKDCTAAMAGVAASRIRHLQVQQGTRPMPKPSRPSEGADDVISIFLKRRFQTEETKLCDPAPQSRFNGHAAEYCVEGKRAKADIRIECHQMVNDRKVNSRRP
jgi:hypothetical protein